VLYFVDSIITYKVAIACYKQRLFCFTGKSNDANFLADRKDSPWRL